MRFLSVTGLLIDHFLLDGRVSKSAVQLRQAENAFLAQHQTLRTVWNAVQNTASFAHGFGSQVLDDITFGLYGRLTHLNWENGSDAFQYGRRYGRVVTRVWAQIEMAFGLALAAVWAESIAPTAGGATTCAALTSGGCLPLGAAALAIEAAGILVGTGVAAHGGAILIRSSANPVGGPQDPTLRYGSNTGDTSLNAQILRRNMEQAGVEAPPDYEAHHIVPSKSPYWSAREARRLLWEKFGIDINAPENGVFVSRSINAHLNNRKYMDAVYEALQQAQTREQAIEILQDIAEQISLTGNYP